MGDFSLPSTVTYQAPDGLATLGSLMSLKQKQQGLQAQQLQMQGQTSQNQSLAAGAQLDTRKAQEQKAVAQIDPNQFEKPDGSADVDGYRRAVMKVAPSTGAGYVESFNQATRGAAETKKAWLSLTGEQQKDMGSVLGAWASDPHSSIQDFGQIATQRIEQAPQPVQGALAKIVNHAQQLMTTQNPDGTPQTLTQQKQKAIMLSRQALSASEQSGAGGLNTPQSAVVNNGAQTLVGTTAPASQGGAFTPATSVVHQLTPGERLPQALVTPAGVVNREPTTGAISAAPAPAGLNPSQAQAQTIAGKAAGVTDRVAQATAQANNTVQAQDALTRAKAILESPTSPKTGSNFESVKGLKNLMSSLGVDTQGADDMNTLSKNLARFEASRATAAGLGHTDAARELAHAGSPGTQLDNKALLGIVRQSLASEKALASYAKVQSNTNDPQQMAKNEADFRNIPHAIEAHEYGMMRSKEEADQYLQEHGLSKAQMKEARDKIKEFDTR